MVWGMGKDGRYGLSLGGNRKGGLVWLGGGVVCDEMVWYGVGRVV